MRRGETAPALYCALFAPTLALGNSLSLHHLQNPKVDFPRVKIFSAIGWIAGGVAVSALQAEKTATQFQLASIISIAFGFFAFTLPHTPPKKVGANVSLGEILGLDALSLMRKPSFALFVVCMFLICIPVYFYFVNMGIYLGQLDWPNFAARMTLAQVSDVVFLFVLAFMLRYIGYRLTIAIGISAWAIRYYFLSESVGSGEATQTALIFAAILLHGVCYDFLFIAAQLYVDAEANERIRGAAQGFIAFVLWGVGAFVGTLLAGQVLAMHKLPEKIGSIEHNWQAIWITPAIGAAAVLVVFLVFFKEPKAAPLPTAPAVPDHEAVP